MRKLIGGLVLAGLLLVGGCGLLPTEAAYECPTSAQPDTTGFAVGDTAYAHCYQINPDSVPGG